MKKLITGIIILFAVLLIVAAIVNESKSFGNRLTGSWKVTFSYTGDGRDGNVYTFNRDGTYSVRDTSGLMIVSGNYKTENEKYILLDALDGEGFRYTHGSGYVVIDGSTMKWLWGEDDICMLFSRVN